MYLSKPVPLLLHRWWYGILLGLADYLVSGRSSPQFDILLLLAWVRCTFLGIEGKQARLSLSQSLEGGLQSSEFQFFIPNGTWIQKCMWPHWSIDQSFFWLRRFSSCTSDYRKEHLACQKSLFKVCRDVWFGWTGFAGLWLVALSLLSDWEDDSRPWLNANLDQHALLSLLEYKNHVDQSCCHLTPICKAYGAVKNDTNGSCVHKA